MSWQPDLDELKRRERFAEQLGGEMRVQRQKDGGRYTIRERIDLLADKRPPVKPGARPYAHANGKLAALIVVGRKPISDGLHVVATHIDSVRIDLKQNPIYDDGNLAMLQTHYYGGIKKYQWLSVPLELRGDRSAASAKIE